MIRIKSEDFDIAKIADSGQCFRLTEIRENRYLLVAIGRILEIGALPDGAVLRCSRKEYERLWRNYFDMDTDYRRFRAAVSGDDAFLSCAVRYGAGIRILRQDPWEMLVTFIISQRKNIPAIRCSVERLCRMAGEPVKRGGLTAYSFPAAGKVAALSMEELRDCSLGYRAPYIHAAAQLAASGQLDLAALGSLDPDGRSEALREIPGVGAKVASCVALFG
jgi:N-glycosylase/DNA lyase